MMMRDPLSLPGLRPGLLAKYQAATTQSAKWEFMRAFLLDPQSLSDVTVEAKWEDVAEREDDTAWVELPLATLRKMHQSEEEKRFLQNRVIDVQSGRAHPQDPENSEMRLYWVYKECTDNTKNRRSISHSLRATGQLPDNKACRAAMADHAVAMGATFGGKGGGAAGVIPAESSMGGKGGKGGKGSGNRRQPKEKAGLEGHEPATPFYMTPRKILHVDNYSVFSPHNGLLIPSSQATLRIATLTTAAS